MATVGAVGLDPATGYMLFDGLRDPPQNLRAAVHRDWLESASAGAEIALENLAGYARGNLIYGAGSDWAPLTIGTNGYILGSDGTDVLWSSVHLDEHAPTGFPNRTDTSLSFDDGTRTLTLAKTGASFDVYVKGVKYTYTENQTKQITDTEGTWWFYIDSAGALDAAQTAPNLRDTAWVAIVYWNATGNVALDIAEERHGMTMDGATHSLLHYTVGTRWESGLAAGDYTLVGDGDSDSDAQLSIGDGVVDDEDLPIRITDDSPQNLDPIAYIPVYYLDGATPVWRKTTADAFPLFDNATDEISYNLDTAGTWSQPAATNNYYVAMWIFATTNVAEPVVAILGQRQDSKLGDAQENNTYESLVFNSLPFEEMKVIYRLIFNTRYPQYTNTPHAKLVDIVDLRSVSNLPAGTYVATAHSSLTGRSARYSHPASAISLDLTNLDHFLSSLVAPTTDDVQAALELLDEIFYGARSVNGAWEFNGDSTWTNNYKIIFYDTDIFIYSPADTILELSADGHVRVGSSAHDHLAGTADSLLVSGKFEVDSTAYFDSSVELYNQVTIYNATNSRFQFYETAVGDGLVAEMRYDTDQALLAVGAPLGRQIIVSDAANYTKDYDHADSGHPALYVQSETDPDSANDEWVSIAFPVTYAEINWGSGALNLAGGSVGIGTATAPHGGVGWAKLAIDGTDSNAAGPHVQFTTASDDYPLLQIFNYSHANAALVWDAYFDGNWRSSAATGNFAIYNTGGWLRFYADTAIAAGDGITWVEAMGISKSGYVMIPGANWLFWRDTAIHIASLDDGHLDLTADISVDINADILSPLSAKHYFDAGAAIGTEYITSGADGNLDFYVAGLFRFYTGEVYGASLQTGAGYARLKSRTGALYLTSSGTENIAITTVGQVLYQNITAHYMRCNMYMDQVDNRYIYQGASNDARTYYDGTNLIIDPDIVGSGKVYIGATADDDLCAAHIGIGTTTISGLLHLKDVTDAQSVLLQTLEGDRATFTDDDEIYQSFKLSNDAGEQTEFARTIAIATDVSDGTEDGAFSVEVMVGGALTEVFRADASFATYWTDLTDAGVTALHTHAAGAPAAHEIASAGGFHTAAGLTIGHVLRASAADAFAFAAIAAGDLPTGIDAAKIGDGSVSNAEFELLDNYNTIGLAALTAAEVDQLENIAATTISAAQWVYLGAMDQGVATGDSPVFSSVGMSANEKISSDNANELSLHAGAAGVVSYEDILLDRDTTEAASLTLQADTTDYVSVFRMTDKDSGHYWDLRMLGTDHATTPDKFWLRAYDGTARQVIVGDIGGGIDYVVMSEDGWIGIGAAERIIFDGDADSIIFKDTDIVDMEDVTLILAEKAASPLGTANQVKIYCVDNGGKTELFAKFGTGVPQQLAIEP